MLRSCPRPKTPGFSTKRILGPGSDYDTSAVDEDDDNNGRRRKRRRRTSDRERPSTNNGNSANNGNRNRNGATGKRRQRVDDTSTGVPSASDRLNQGLSSSRAGFTVEEMEALRAAKKNAA